LLDLPVRRLGESIRLNLSTEKARGIEVLAYPFADLFVPIMFGVSERVDKFVVSGDASAVVSRAPKLPVDGDRIFKIEAKWGGKKFLQNDGVFPVITEVVRVYKLGARPPQHLRGSNHVLVFYMGHTHASVFRVMDPEVSISSSEFVHVTARPAHRGLQHIV